MISIKTKKAKDLSKLEKDFINEARVKAFGKSEVKDFGKDYEPNMLWFFVKDKNKIVALGSLRSITIHHRGKKYKILGFGSGIAIERGKGYGKALMKARIAYLKRRKKTGLGFCGRKNLKFFEKCGLKTKKNFIKRFVYKDPKTGKEIMDEKGDGIYYNGKDNFIKKVLSTRNIVYIPILHW